MCQQVDFKIDEILSLRVRNANGYFIPINKLVTMTEAEKPINIGRVNFKRTTQVYADIKANSETTPLMIAQSLEQDLIPQLINGRIALLNFVMKVPKLIFRLRHNRRITITIFRNFTL